MYQLTDGFKNAILGDLRKFYTKITSGGVESLDVVRNIKYYSQVSGGANITIGGAYAAYVDLELWNPGFQLEKKEFTLSLGIDTDDGVQWCPIGVFTAETPKTSNDGLITVTAYDRIQSKLSGAYFSNLKYPTDAKNILNEISSVTGVPIDTSNLSSGVMVNQVPIITESSVDDAGSPVTNTNYGNPFDGYSYREAIGYIAMLYCKYAIADKTGVIKFVWFANTDYELSGDRFYNDIETAEVVFTVGSISCQTGQEELLAGSGTENIQLENPVMTQARLNYIYNQVKNLQFIPVRVPFYGDIRVEPGDIVTVNNIDGKVYKVPVMNISHEFDGGLKSTAESYGGTEQESISKGPTIQRLERQYAELFLVKELVGKKANFDYVYSLSGEFKTLKAETAEFELLVAGQIKTVNAEIENVKANNITTENLSAKLAEIDVLTVETANLKYASVDKLEALEGDFKDLSAKSITTDNIEAEVAKLNYATIKDLEAVDGKIENLDSVYVKTENLSAEVAELGFATIDRLEAVEGKFDSITSDYLDVKLSNIDIANIDKASIATMFVELGLIDKAVIENGHVTGYLDSVSINANSIKAGTLSVDRLVINGSTESLIFALNNAGKLVSTSVDTLDGGLLTERTITADKLVAHSITANEITTSNIIGSSGWINLAEGTFNYGNRLIWDGEHLTIQADSIKSVAGGNYATQEDISRMKIGARNLVRNSKTLNFDEYYFGKYSLPGYNVLDEEGNVLVDENGLALVTVENGGVE